MLIFLPLLALFILVLIWRTHESSWREAMLAAAVLWGVLIVAITESLSLFHVLSAGWVATLWSLVIFVLLFISWHRLSTFIPVLFRSRPVMSNPQVGSLPLQTKQEPLSLSSIVLLMGTGLIVSAIAVIAVVAPPNNWDSMTYHMSRVENWRQNHSVAHYPTHMIPQLQRGPWAEFAVLHLQLLSDGDRFADTVQWLSMVGCIVGTSLLAAQLGADRRGQLFAAVLTSAIPIGILEASTTQTDYAVTLWMVCFVSFLLRLIRQETPEVLSRVPWLAGAALGLAVLTKATTYFFAAPWVLWGASALWMRHRLQSWRPLLVMLGLTLLINSGHYWRNYDLFGSPVGPTRDTCAGCEYANESHAPAIILSNLLRNVGLHLGTFSVTLNSASLHGIEALHRLLGVESNDPRSTWGGHRFGIPYPTANENSDGNLLHLLLIAIVLPMVFFHRRLRYIPLLSLYIVCLVTGFFLFCLYLKWWANHSRLHLPLFVLWSPVIGLTLSRLRSQKWSLAVVLFVLIASLPWVFMNGYRPTVGERTIFNTPRYDQYFFRNPNDAATFMNSSQFVKDHGCTRIGLVRGFDDWEYPFWVLLKTGPVPAWIQHVSVTNESSILAEREPFRSFRPCALIAVEGFKVTVTLNVDPGNPDTSRSNRTIY